MLGRIKYPLTQSLAKFVLAERMHVLPPFVGLRVTDDLPCQSLRYHTDCSWERPPFRGAFPLSLLPDWTFSSNMAESFSKNLPMPETIGRLLSISDDVLQKACATCDFIHQGDVLISFEGSLQVKQQRIRDAIAAATTVAIALPQLIS